MANILMQLRRRLTRIRAVRQGDVTVEEAVEFEETMTYIQQAAAPKRSSLEPISPAGDETDEEAAPEYSPWQRFADRLTDPEFSGAVFDYLPTRGDSNMVDMSYAPGKGGGGGSMLGGSILPGGKKSGDSSLLPGGKRGSDSLLPGGGKGGGDSSLLPRGKSGGDSSLLGGSVLPGGRKKGK